MSEQLEELKRVRRSLVRDVEAWSAQMRVRSDSLARAQRFYRRSVDDVIRLDERIARLEQSTATDK